MKNNWKKIATVTFLILMMGSLSCSLVDDGCGRKGDWSAKVTDMVWGLYEIEETADTRFLIHPIQADSVNYDVFVIQALADLTEYKLATYDDDNPFSFSFVQRAYACSLVPLMSDEVVQNITITSDVDFDATHPAGANLADLFDVQQVDYELDYDRADLIAWLADSPTTTTWTNLILKSPPAESGHFTFTVTYTQDGVDLDEFTFETDSVYIEK